MNSSLMRQTIIPVALSFVVLILFNIGLYFRLSAQPRTVELALPYTDTFDTASTLDYPRFGGDWDIRDETLVQISTTGFDLGLLIPLDIANDQPYQASVDLRYLGGSMGGGILFNAQNGQTRQQSHMVRFNVDNDALYIIFGYFGDDSDFQGQGSVLLDTDPESDVARRLGIQVSDSTYNILLDDNTIATDIPLESRGGAVGLITSGSQVSFDNVLVDVWDGASVPITLPDVPQATPPQRDDIDLSGETLLLDTFDTTGTGESLWLPFSGEWQFSNGAFLQTQANGFDLGTGYNRELGDGVVEVTFQHEVGQGAGVLFNMAQPDSRNQAHMVRYVHDADFVVWGYFDADGVFEAQGSIPVTAPADDTHILQVLIQPQTYSIVLDGALLAADIPLVMTGDYHGLVTAQSSARFDSFVVRTMTDLPQQPATGVSLNAITGNWTFGDVITQQSSDTVDYIAGTGIAAETFRVDVVISLPDELEDAGAGIVFHTSERDSVANGQMVRFGSGGQEIFWGQYDSDGIFAGQGSAPLDLDWTDAHTLTLIVSTDSYNVLVDDEIIITDVPVIGDFGWINLLSYRGAVQFADFEVSIGQ